METNPNNLPDPKEQTAILEAALAYAGMGFSTIPIKPRSKVPGLRRWMQYQERRPREEEIRGWFDGSRERNLAVVCGEVSGGLFVLDFDDPQAFDYVFDKEVFLASETLVARTGGGGYHVYLRAEGSQTPKKSSLRRRHAKDRGPHLPVDIQGEKSYVVAPPSVHESGESYVWMGQREKILEVVPEEALGSLQARAEEWPLVEIMLPSWLEGIRHGVALGFAAFLRKNLGWPEDRAARVIEGICRLAGDREVQDRLRGVKDTYLRSFEEISLEGLDPENLRRLRRFVPSLKDHREQEREAPSSEEIPEGSRVENLEEGLAALQEYIVFKESWEPLACLLWACQVPLAGILPGHIIHLSFSGAKSSGKSEATKLMGEMMGGKHLAGGTAAAFMRGFAEYPALGIDELDENAGRLPEVEAMVRAATDRDSIYQTSVPAGKGRGWVTKDVEVGRPVVYNYRGKVDDALLSRTVNIELPRRGDTALVLRNLLGGNPPPSCYRRLGENASGGGSPGVDQGERDGTHVGARLPRPPRRPPRFPGPTAADRSPITRHFRHHGVGDRGDREGHPGGH